MYICLKFAGDLVLRGVESVLDIKVPAPAALQARSVASAVVAWFRDPEIKPVFVLLRRTLQLSYRCASPVQQPHIHDLM